MREGDILEIALPDSSIAYGRVLNSPLIGFYETRSIASIIAETPTLHRYAFKIWVHRSYGRRWKVIANKSLSGKEKELPWFVHQDGLTDKVSLYRQGGGYRIASLHDIESLERDAIWDSEQVEQRLMDFFEQRPNLFVANMRDRAIKAFQQEHSRKIKSE